ncbi:MAG TPA: right-handed parallel beta-helix repeat-containing protein [Kofleriaceae bacterium]|nr:right-handed parallel beta-helix repeat-containing protein [Kofleriaceae bacterium]
MHWLLVAMLYEIHPGDDLFARLAQLAPGDEVVVHSGTYTTPGFFQVTWAGTPSQPIIVRAADGETRPVIMGDPSQNVIDLSGSYFTLRGFEIRGGSHGVRLANADHATLDDLVLHDLGDVGISCNRDGDTCDHVTISHSEIYDTGHAGTGEGMYLGCNDAACSFVDSIVEGNYVHDTGGDQGDGIEVKTGAYGNVVRDNVIVRTKYPAITMYGYAGAQPRNVVERNLVWTTQDNGIQVVGQVVVRNNIVLGAAASGIASKASQAMTPHDLEIVNNTIVGAAGTTCLKSNDWATATGQVVANNALDCEGGTAIDLNGGAPNAIVAANLTVVAAELGDPATAHVYPPSGSPVIDKGDSAHAAADDFNGTARTDGKPDVGAYERTTDTNPGWDPHEGFKTPPAAGAIDAGVTSPDAGGSGAAPGGCCDARGDRTSALFLLAIVVALRRYSS